MRTRHAIWDAAPSRLRFGFAAPSRLRFGMAAILTAWTTGPALGQTTSLRARCASTQPSFSTGETPVPHGRPVPQASGREAPAYEGNRTLEKHSLIAVAVTPPKTFKVHDLITVIVRQQRKFESDADQDSKRKFELQSELDAFLKFTGGGVGAAEFRRGKPNVDYKYDSKVTNEAGKNREDKLTTRITAEIIDVKPNGNLVLQATAELRFDEEKNRMTLTGTCRQTDVTPDNTVLSTQLADLMIKDENAGAVKDGSSRGWLTRTLDLLKPI